ncbi:hypothetical protein V9T40_003427 [Parthenolecanium corni]|uniref:Uncharacterized protein n=1 Tax=Parthenolecanium corni TaxID=536013 RepID=A0AAN9U2M0_9HEMI
MSDDATWSFEVILMASYLTPPVEEYVCFVYDATQGCRSTFTLSVHARDTKVVASVFEERGDSSNQQRRYSVA